MLGDRLGIVEFRNIIGAIREFYGIDYSDYALTSLKRRVEKFLYDSRFVYPIEFIEKIREDRQFFDKFVKEITVKETEMFRDPSFWQCLRKNVAPKLGEGDRVLVANTNSGEELYSLAILFREAGILDHLRIVAVNISQKNIDFIKTGAYELKKMESYHANYERAGGYRKLSDYYITNNNKAYMDSSLIDNVEFIKTDITSEGLHDEYKLIVFRNVMLYYNKTLKNRMLNMIYHVLEPRGYLAIGIKENIDDNLADKYLLINKDEKVYKKTN